MSPGGAVPWGSLALLAGWALAIIAVAAPTFRWE
jgi:hypothetical protein